MRMWRIKQIFDGEYGCEESNEVSRVSLTLQDETGNKKYAWADDSWLRRKGLDEGTIWPYQFWGNEHAAVIAKWIKMNNNIDKNQETELVKPLLNHQVVDSVCIEDAANVQAYNGIETPFDLYDALSDIWCAETCAPRMRNKWSKENRTLGQCSITAFLVQDIFGGKVYGIKRPGGNYHCYNVIDDAKFDLTSEQFGNEILDYGNNPEQFREIHFQKEEKRKRYELLKEKLYQYCNEK